MSLINTESLNGYLEATGEDAVAVSKQIAQDTGANISESSPTVLNTQQNPQQSTNPGVGLTIDRDGSVNDAYYILSNYDIGALHYGSVGDTYYTFTFDTAKVINSFQWRTSIPDYNPNIWNISASNDGINWDVLIEVPDTGYYVNALTQLYEWANETAYTMYRWNIASTYGGPAYSTRLYEMYYYYTSQPDYDTLRTSTPIVDGDPLVIIKDDESIHNVIASGVTGTAPYVMDTTSITAGEIPSTVYLKSTFESDFSQIRNISMDLEYGNISESIATPSLINLVPVMTSNTEPSGVADSTTGDAYLTFDSDSLTYDGGVADGATHFWVTYEFASAVDVLGYGIRSAIAQTKFTPRTFRFEGWNGTTWDILHSRDTLEGDLWTGTLNLLIDFDLGATYTYSKFRFYCEVGSYGSVRVGDFKMYNSEFLHIDKLVTINQIVDGDSLVIVKDDDSIHPYTAAGVTGSGPYEMDTTSVTTGEIPTRVYKLDDSIEFNDVTPLNPADTFSVVTDLKSTRDYDDMFISGRIIETKVSLSNGNKMISLTADVDKIVE